MPTVKGVFENLIAGGVLAVILLVGTWATDTIDTPVPLWLLILSSVVVLIAGFSAGKLTRDNADLPAYQADLVGEAILALRDHAAGRLAVPLSDLVELGILAPARFGLSVVRGEEIRLSVVEPDESGNSFRMVYAAGHSLGRKDNFSLSKASIAGHAFDSKELQWTDDVSSDKRWSQHPKADAKRGYKSLAAMPIVVDDEAVAVLNVISTEPCAFLKGDLTYIELLGALIALALDLGVDADASNRLAAESSSETKGKT